MSLILDALNKADRQREHKAPVPHLGSYHSEPKAHVSGVPVWAIYAVVGLLVLVVLALMLLVFKGGDWTMPRPSAQVSAISAAAEASDFSKREAAQAQPAEPQQTEKRLETHSKGAGAHNMAVQSPSAHNADAQYRQSSQAGLNADAAQTVIEQDPVLSQKVASIYQRVGDQAAQRSRANSAREPDVATDLYTEKPTAQGSTEISKDSRASAASSQLQALWEATQQEISGARSAAVPSDPYRSIPYLHQLPESFKARIPTLAYDNHIFSPKGGAVILNGKTYRVGDRLAQDLVIDAIAEEYLVLSYLQKPFRLKALSSWIQMN
ncbi:general secretion pathway protein GspB [Marinagarivorans algicola]|uniref:general secretion pathway protein GspB n=1 Tax=Marinagarivorans algicola TaxID=1513270 RepID=UPI0006B639F0|nr:general secretion pathway protein GspB [Marinagarivorans algicola]